MNPKNIKYTDMYERLTKQYKLVNGILHSIDNKLGQKINLKA